MNITIDYRKLKLCKHGLPTWDALLPITLAVVNNQSSPINRKILSNEVVANLSLPDNLRYLKSKKNPVENIIDARMTWPISELALAGLLERPKRGTYQITPLGKQLLKKFGNQITAKMVHEQPKYLRHQEELAKKNNVNSPINVISNDIEDDVDSFQTINSLINQYNNKISLDLLDRIQDGTPYFFEKLVVNLLTTMGYKGSNGEAIVTQKSNDSGIDGIINQDALGTSTVYLQAKRYQIGNKVGRNELQAFVGALSGVGSDRGVFITTSDFSANAIEYGKNQHIVLINGLQLSDLMLQYKVGVNIKNKYITFDIDEDFFIDD
ncbi:restriction endonuclease [Dellaglioa carnosa]|uniref:restriction endonuclease n=1 Tax=Dellaglioa carnosa TaxID=2995136 RepID=UPI0022A85464|nr:restriction endonuclease [Dellaglioa carnosa]MCZ2493391.1 restriction endonuclease [Dellaglioa carnosa]